MSVEPVESSCTPLVFQHHKCFVFFPTTSQLKTACFVFLHVVFFCRESDKMNFNFLNYLLTLSSHNAIKVGDDNELNPLRVRATGWGSVLVQISSIWSWSWRELGVKKKKMQMCFEFVPNEKCWCFSGLVLIWTIHIHDVSVPLHLLLTLPSKIK